MPRKYTIPCNENSIVRACIDLLATFDFTVWRNNAGIAERTGSYGQKYQIKLSPAGTSDIIGFSPSGRFVAVECKVPGNKTTPRQEVFLERAKEKGCYSCVAYSSADVEWIIDEEQKLKHGGSRAT